MGCSQIDYCREVSRILNHTLSPFSSLPPKFSALPLSQDSLVATIATVANRAVALSAKAHSATTHRYVSLQQKKTNGQPAEKINKYRNNTNV